MIIDFPETFDKVGPALVRTGNWDPTKTFVTDGLDLERPRRETSGADATDGLRGTAPGVARRAAQPSEAFDKLYTAADRRTSTARRSTLRTSTP